MVQILQKSLQQANNGWSKLGTHIFSFFLRTTALYFLLENGLVAKKNCPVLQLDHLAGFLPLSPFLLTANQGSQPWPIQMTFSVEGPPVMQFYQFAIRVVLPRQHIVPKQIHGHQEKKQWSYINNSPNCATQYRCAGIHSSLLFESSLSQDWLKIIHSKAFRPRPGCVLHIWP